MEAAVEARDVDVHDLAVLERARVRDAVADDLVDVRVRVRVRARVRARARVRVRVRFRVRIRVRDRDRASSCIVECHRFLIALSVRPWLKVG